MVKEALTFVRDCISDAFCDNSYYQTGKEHSSNTFVHGVFNFFFKEQKKTEQLQRNSFNWSDN